MVLGCFKNEDIAPCSIEIFINVNDRRSVTGDYFVVTLFEMGKDEAPIKIMITETDCTVLKVATHDFELFITARGSILLVRTFLVLGWLLCAASNLN